MFDFLPKPLANQEASKPFKAFQANASVGTSVKSRTGAFSPEADDAVASLTWLPDDMELLAREDIYALPASGSASGATGLLLLPAGVTVKPHMLPKLIRHGAKPTQFIIQNRETGETQVVETPLPTTPVGATLPEALQGSAPRVAATGAHAMDMVLIDPSDKHMRKLIDTLTMAGVRMPHLHCSHDPAQLIEWVKRVRPSVLIVDEAAHPLTSMVAKLNSLRRTFGIEHVILTVAPQATAGDVVDRDRILEQARQAGIEVVTKPLNTFSVSKAVRLYKAKLSLARQMADEQF
jgi:AmiR/NasT family two-component response regulator